MDPHKWLFTPFDCAALLYRDPALARTVHTQDASYLDVIHDTSPEGVFTLVKESPSSKGWFPGFPYGHPDPTLPQVIFNQLMAT